MSPFKKCILSLLVIATVTLGGTSLVFAQDAGNKQGQTPKADSPAVAAAKTDAPAAPAKNVVEATITGQNFCLACELKEKGAGAQCSTYGHMRAFRVTKAIVDGKEQADMQGWVLRYMPTKNSLDLIRSHDDETVTVTGKLYRDERVIEVSSFTVAGAPKAPATAPKAPATAPAVTTKGITWHQSLPEALAEAKERNTLVVVDFYAEWCHWCKQLDVTTFTDPQVQAQLQNFSLLRVDTDKQPGLAQRYGVTGLPTTMVLDAKGTMIARQDGYLPADGYLKLLAQAKSR